MTPITEQDIAQLHKRIDALEFENKRFHQALSAPTVPIYDNSNFPQDAVEGQIALGTDANEWKYQNGLWSKIGGGSESTDEQTLTGSSASVNSMNAADISYSSYTGVHLFDITSGSTASCLIAGKYLITCHIELQSSWPATAYARFGIVVNAINPFSGDTAGPFGSTISFPSITTTFGYYFGIGNTFSLNYFNGHPSLARSCNAQVYIQTV